MAYELSSITIRTNNSQEGLAKIEEIWRDITGGRLPILFNSEHAFRQGVSPISKYSGYESDETGDYDLSILGVKAEFFGELEQAVGAGRYKKYDEAGEDLLDCTRRAWGRVWSEQRNGDLSRAYTEDFESTVPAEYTKDGKAHCYLYIAVK